MAAPPAPPPSADLLPSLHVLGPDDAPNTLELYIDFVCLRSRALFRGSIMGPSRDMDGVEMSPGALAVIFGDPKFDTRFKRFKVVVRPFFQARKYLELDKYRHSPTQLQGVHLGSKVTHEVALAVLTVAPKQFWTFCDAVFEKQLAADNYFDERVDGMTPNDLRTELLALTKGLLPEDETTFPRVRSLLCSPKSCPGKLPVERSDTQAPDPTAGTIRICESLRQVVQKSYLKPVSAPGVAFWNDVPIPEFSPNWGQLEWSTFLMNRLS